MRKAWRIWRDWSPLVFASVGAGLVIASVITALFVAEYARATFMLVLGVYLEHEGGVGMKRTIARWDAEEARNAE